MANTLAAKHIVANRHDRLAANERQQLEATSASGDHIAPLDELVVVAVDDVMVFRGVLRVQIRFPRRMRFEYDRSVGLLCDCEACIEAAGVIRQTRPAVGVVGRCESYGAVIGWEEHDPRASSYECFQL